MKLLLSPDFGPAVHAPLLDAAVLSGDPVELVSELLSEDELEDEVSSSSSSFAPVSSSL